MTAAALEHSLDSPPWTPDTSAPAVIPKPANDGERDELVTGLLAVCALLRSFHRRAFSARVHAKRPDHHRAGRAAAGALKIIIAWLATDEAVAAHVQGLGQKDRIRFERSIRVQRELQRVQTLDEPWKEPGQDKATRKILREAREARTQGEIALEEARRLRQAAREARLSGRWAEAARDKAAAAVAAEGGHAAIRTAVELERQAQLRVDERKQARWSGAVLTERKTLEATRGSETEDVLTEVSDWVRDENGALVRDRRGVPLLGTDKARTVRVLASEGLRVAFDNGDLDRKDEDDRFSADTLLATGKRFRDAYETYASLASPDRDAGAPSAPRCKPSTGPQNAAFEAGEEIRLMTGRLSAAQISVRRFNGMKELIPMTDLELKVVALVCGRDETVRAAARQVRKRHDTVRLALRSGLVTATINTVRE